MIQGFADYWVLVAAIELGAVRRARRRGTPAPTEGVAAALGADRRAPHALLDALVAMGFVEEVAGGGLVLSDTAARYLTTDGAASMAELVRGRQRPARELAGARRHGAQGRPAPRRSTTIPPSTARSSRPRFPTQLRAATRLAARIGLSRRPGLRVLDLGAGAAPWTIAVLQASEGSTAVVNDLPGVIELADGDLAVAGARPTGELRAGDLPRHRRSSGLPTTSSCSATSAGRGRLRRTPAARPLAYGR